MSVTTTVTAGGLTLGTRVRVARRGGAEGIIDQEPRTPRPGVRPVASIRFDGKRPAWGLNYPEDVEVTRPASPAETAAILGRARALALLSGDFDRALSRAVREFAATLDAASI